MDIIKSRTQPDWCHACHLRMYTSSGIFINCFSISLSKYDVNKSVYPFQEVITNHQVSNSTDPVSMESQLISMHNTNTAQIEYRNTIIHARQTHPELIVPQSHEINSD